MERNLASNEPAQLVAQAVQQSAVPMVITDLAPRIVFVNDAFCRMTGYSRDELVGANPSVLSSGQTPREVYGEMWMTILSGRTWHGDLSNRRKNGEVYVESLFISPMADEHGAIRHFVGSWQDVSERQREKCRLIGEVKSLKEACTSLEEFAHTASHDLRAPLNHIVSFSELLIEDLRGLDDGSVSCLEQIRSSGKRLLTLVNETLELSKITTKEPPREGVCLNEVLSDVVNDLGTEIALAGSTVAVADLPTIEGFRGHFYRLFLNLIGNAVKFRSSERAHQVSVAARDLGEEVELTVTDNGLGFDMALAERLFAPFERFHGIEGTGMGLAICAKIAAHHGGSIHAEGRRDEGATFTVRLPRTQARRLDAA